MDPSEYGLSNADFGLPPENDGAPSTDAAAMFALASQGAAIEQQMRTRGAQGPAPIARPRPQPVQHPVYAQPTAVDNALDLIERRLNLAGYYRALLEQPIFETDDEDALLVEDEIRAFIFERLSDLLGTSKPKPAPPPQVKLPFSAQQVQALTAIADALLAKKQAAATPPPPAAVPATPTVQPVRRAAPQPPPPVAEPQVEEEQPQEQEQIQPQEQPQEEPPPPAVRAAPRVRANRGPRQAMVAPVAVAQQPAARPAQVQPQGPVVPRPARRGARPAQRALVPPPPAAVERDPGRRSEAEGHALAYVDEHGQPPVLPLAMPTGAAMTAVTAAKASETAASIARSGGIVHRE